MKIVDNRDVESVIAYEDNGREWVQTGQNFIALLGLINKSQEFNWLIELICEKHTSEVI